MSIVVSRSKKNRLSDLSDGDIMVIRICFSTPELPNQQSNAKYQYPPYKWGFHIKPDMEQYLSMITSLLGCKWTGIISVFKLRVR